MVNLNEIRKGIIEGNRDKVLELTRASIDANVAAKEILDKGLIPGIIEVGNLFEVGEYYLPEMIISAKITLSTLELLDPILSKANIPPTGKYLIGTVQNDVHDIGKNIVVMMLRGSGWKVTDLGVDVSPETFCLAVGKGDFQILGLSALLTTTMPNTAKTINALKDAGLRNKVKIMVGGVSTTQEWAAEIGADGYAPDAGSAISVARDLIGKS